jgi:hypothetical protein
MSAWLVDNDCINRILSAIPHVIEDNYTLRQALYTAMGYADDGSQGWFLPQGWQAKLGQMMFEMNMTALGDRYGDRLSKPQDWRTETHPDGYTYKYNPLPLKNSPLQQLKSFSCYMYQCSEGDVPDSKLYKALDRIQDQAFYHYVSRLPEYDQAEWG